MQQQRHPLQLTLRAVMVLSLGPRHVGAVVQPSGEAEGLLERGGTARCLRVQRRCRQDQQPLHVLQADLHPAAHSQRSAGTLCSVICLSISVSLSVCLLSVCLSVSLSLSLSLSLCLSLCLSVCLPPSFPPSLPPVTKSNKGLAVRQVFD